MAAKKKTSKPAKNHPWRSEMKKHGKKHEGAEGSSFEKSERGRKGYARGREMY
jgi:hypothetical protein